MISLQTLCIRAVANTLAQGDCSLNLAILPPDLLNRIASYLIKNKKLSEDAFCALVNVSTTGILRIAPFGAQLSDNHLLRLSSKLKVPIQQFWAHGHEFSPVSVSRFIKSATSLRVIDVSPATPTKCTDKSKMDWDKSKRDWVLAWTIEDPESTFASVATALRDLRLCSVKMSPELHNVIKTMTSLTTLSLTSCTFIKESALMELISSLPNVERWALSQLPCTSSRTLQHILTQGHSQLRSISLHMGSVSSTMTKPLDPTPLEFDRQRLERLEFFSCSGLYTPSQILQVVEASSRSLRTLALMNLTIGDEELSAILDNCADGLELLQLSNIKNPSSLSIKSPNLIHLKLELNLSFITIEAPALLYAEISGLSATVLRADLPSVEYLCCLCTPPNTVLSLFETAASFPNLQSLNLRWTEIADDKLAAMISKCPALKHLDTYWNDLVGNLTLYSIIENCRDSIEILNLAGDMGNDYEQEAFDALLASCKKLKDIGVYWNYNVTPSEEDQQRPGLIVRWIGSPHDPLCDFPEPTPRFFSSVGYSINIPPQLAAYPFFEP